MISNIQLTMSSARPRTSILDKPISRGKGEVSLSSFALLFSEVVQYSQNRVCTVPELQNRWITFIHDKTMEHYFKSSVFDLFQIT